MKRELVNLFILKHEVVDTAILTGAQTSVALLPQYVIFLLQLWKCACERPEESVGCGSLLKVEFICLCLRLVVRLLKQSAKVSC